MALDHTARNTVFIRIFMYHKNKITPLEITILQSLQTTQRRMQNFITVNPKHLSFKKIALHASHATILTEQRIVEKPLFS